MAELRRSNTQEQYEVSRKPAWRAGTGVNGMWQASLPVGRLAAGKEERRLGGDQVEVLMEPMLL